MIPVVGDTVQFTKRVVPREGPAIGGRLEVHAGIVIAAKPTPAAVLTLAGRIPPTSEGWMLDLKILGPDGDTYVERRVTYHGVVGSPEAEGKWSDRPALTAELFRMRQHERLLGVRSSQLGAQGTQEGK